MKNELIELLDRKIENLKGDVITPLNGIDLKRDFKNYNIWSGWFDILQAYPLIGCEFSLSKDFDSSGFGVELKIMSAEDIKDEAFNFYPGNSALIHGFLPFGICMIGSGDPYFLFESDERSIEVYRIPHDAIDENDQLILTNIEFVCSLPNLIRNGIL